MWLPNEEYTDHTLRCLLPELGSALGYKVTAEVTTNAPYGPGLDCLDYYAYVESQPGPLVAVFRDVDSRSGRRANFGNGIARVHQRLGILLAVGEGVEIRPAGVD